MNILFLSNWFPYPPDNGSKLRIYNLMRGLGKRHDVTLVSFTNHPADKIPRQLSSLCRNIYIIPERSYNGNSLRAILGLFSSRPRVLVDRHVPQMAETICREIESGQYDLAIASQWYMAAYLESLPQVPAIFEEVEVGIFADKVLHAANSMQRLRHRLTTLKMSRYFQELLGRFNACTVVSPQERSLLQGMAPGYRNIEVIPNGVNLSDYRDLRVKPQPDSLIFTGSFRYSANYEAMLWFLNQVYPQVRSEAPGARLTITGDHAGRPLPNLKNVILTGFVKEVQPLIASSWISIVPILSGGGTRLKILEAMALCTPVVSTSKGAEGLEVENGKHLLLADDPEEFAGAVTRLLKDANLRSQLAANALQLVREKYDWQVILPNFLRLVEQAVDA